MNDARLGLGRGVVAVVINIVVVIGLLIVLGLLFGKAHTGQGSASVNLTGVSALIWFVLALAYLIVPKVRTGQTIGRRLVGGQPSK
jgi:RDD family